MTGPGPHPATGPSAAVDAGPTGPTGFEDAVAAVTAGFPADPREAARHYRRLARLLHPDTAPAGRGGEATEAFARLTAAWRARQRAISGPRHTYRLGPVLAEGDLATLYRADYDRDGRRHAAVLKIPRKPRDNDLMEHEADVLTRLRKVGEERHRGYAPTLVESFRERHDDGTEHRVNVLAPLAGFHTLAEVAAAHPGGLDPRDAAWMWRRLLTALGWAHRAGLVHGAVFPEHVLIHPAQHGLVLIDWCYATATGTDLPMLLPGHAADYPPEARAHEPATAATDIHLAARCVAALMGRRTPAPMRAFLRGCTLPEQHRRPQDAWALLAELDDLLERLHGPRTFRPFAMP